jgi:hypothetical protein
MYQSTQFTWTNGDTSYERSKPRSTQNQTNQEQYYQPQTKPTYSNSKMQMQNYQGQCNENDCQRPLNRGPFQEPLTSYDSRSLIPETGIMTNNKRELANDKINERMLFAQTNRNPFFTDHKYLDDLEIQENFLKPKNSNYEEYNPSTNQ